MRLIGISWERAGGRGRTERHVIENRFSNRASPYLGRRTLCCGQTVPDSRDRGVKMHGHVIPTCERALEMV